MQASSYLRLALKWWWLLILAMSLGGAAAWLASSLITETYRASSTLLVVHQGVDGTLDPDDLEASTRLADTVVSLITTRPVLEAVIESGQFNLSPDELRDSVTLEHGRDSQVIEIRASAEDPTVARDIANGLATVVIASQAAAFPTTVISVVEAATTPGGPISPRRPVNAAIGALLAATIGALGLVLRERSDDSLNSVEDLQPLALPALGLLRDSTAAGAGERPTAYHPDSDRADDYRRVGANLNAVLAQHASSFGRKAILLTNAYPQTGAGVAVNLAIALGAAGYRVLLVDGDLREPTMHTEFSLPNGEGLAAYLRGGSPPVARRVDIANSGSTGDAPTRASATDDSSSANTQAAPYSTVFFVSAGSAQSNAGDILGSSAMRSVVSDWRAAYDLVLVHGAPLDRSDAAILATVMDAIVVVARAGETRAGDLLRLVGEVAGPGAIVAGVILDAARGGFLPERDELPEQLPARAVEPAPSRAAARAQQRLSRVRHDADAE